jgi:membrane fusion protein (multidrug efflux system)
VDVLVDEHSPVTAGRVLARLDPRDFEIRKAQATAQLAQAQAQQRQAQARLAEARAQVAREQARTGKARLDLDRARSLYRGSTGAISKQEFDQAAAEAEGAEAALEAARASVGSAEALVAVADAQRQVAQAGLDDAELQLFYTQIIAPVDGRIGKKNLEVGNRVQAGQPLLGLVQPEVWITANYKETQLARIRPGQPVRIRIDAFPGRHFSGQVASLSPASGAQFALLPPDNATGNFTRIVQRVPVKILLTGPELTEYAGCLVPGMSAIAEVKAGGT